MRKFIKYSLVLTLFFTFVSTVFSQGNSKFYIDLIKTSGIRAQYISQSDTQESTPSKFVLNKDTSTLVSFASTIQDLPSVLDSYTVKRLIVICDKDISYLGSLCTYNSVRTTDTASLVNYDILNFLSYRVNSTDVLLIPQQYFVYPDYQEKLQGYLSSLSRTDLGTVALVAQRPAGGISRVLLNNVSYIFLIILFALLLSSVLHQLEKDPKRFFDTTFYKDFALKTINFLENYRSLYISLFILTFLLYVVALTISFFVLGSDGGFPRLISLITFSFDIKELTNVLMERKFLQILLSGGTYFLIVLFGLIFVPGIFKLLITLSEKENGVRLTSSFGRTVFFVSFIVLSFIIGFFTIQSAYIFISFFLLALIYVIFKADIGITAKERISLLILFLGLFIVGQLWTIYKSNNARTYKVIPLFTNFGGKMILPYKKDFSGNVGFDVYKVSSTVSVFANSYAIYDPKFSVILNKPLSYLDTSDPNYLVILDNDVTNYISVLRSNVLNLNIFSTDTFSGFFSYDFSKNYASKYEAEVIMNCATSKSSGIMKIIAYSKDFTEEKSLLFYTGCNEGEKQVTLKVPFPPTYSDGVVLYAIKDYDSSGVIAFNLYKDDQKQNILYFKNPVQNNIIFSKYTDYSKPLTVYGSGIKEEITFSRDTSVIDLSQRINSLLERNLIQNSVTLWTNINGMVLTEIK